MKKYPITLVCLMAISLSCSSPKSESEESTAEIKTEDQLQDELYQEVIEVHDVAMLKMETIMSLKNRAINEADSLRELSNEALFEQINLLENKQINLEEANKAMMVWMRAFRPVADSTSHADAMEYLESELIKIEEVNARMDSVITAANPKLD